MDEKQSCLDESPNNFLDLNKHARVVVRDTLHQALVDVFETEIPEAQKTIVAGGFQRPKHGRGELCVQFHRFARQLKTKPQQIAERIGNHVQDILNGPDSSISGIVNKIVVDGPYINFYFRISYMGQLIDATLNGTNSFVDQRVVENPEKVMVEYSQPNTHKAFHVGHMRNCALGDCLVRLYRHLGFNVVPVNYFGDEGAHVAKCLWMLNKTATDEELHSVPPSDRGEFLGAMYSKAVDMISLSSLTSLPYPGIIAAKVLTKDKHPDPEASPLWRVLTVDKGDETCALICGGSHYEVGHIVAYCPVGGTYKGKVLSPKDMKGIQSCGVVMGALELGVDLGPMPKEKVDESKEQEVENVNDGGKKRKGGKKQKQQKKKKKGSIKDQRILILDDAIPPGTVLTEYGRKSKSNPSKVCVLRWTVGGLERKQNSLYQNSRFAEASALQAQINELKSEIFSLVHEATDAEKARWEEEEDLPSHETLLRQYAEYFREAHPLDPGTSVDEEFSARQQAVRETLSRLEDKEEKTDALWQKTKKWSIDEFKKIYAWLDCEFQHDFFESDCGTRSKEVVMDYYEKGVFKKSEGAIGVDLKKYKLGFALLIKSDGNGLYLTKDLTLAQDKFTKYNVDRSIYVVDDAQQLHFKQAFKILELMGYEQAKKCIHLYYGLVTLPHGVKMSSRDGTVIYFSQLRNMLKKKIFGDYFTPEKRAEVKERRNVIWTDDEIVHAVHAISVGTIKYGMLNQSAALKIEFSLDEWANRSGNTGPYLMMQYTRIASIGRIVAWPEEGEVDYSLLSHDKERFMLGQIMHFWDVVEDCVKSHNPAPLCTYLYEMCQAFSSWHKARECSIKHAKTPSIKKTRLRFVQCVAEVFKTGLNLLGIETLEKM